MIRHCRVGILNEIGELLGPQVAVLLIGERPGLATAESLSAYMAYRPEAAHTDADRNLISNIHARGVLPQAACHANPESGRANDGTAHQRLGSEGASAVARRRDGGLTLLPCFQHQANTRFSATEPKTCVNRLGRHFWQRCIQFGSAGQLERRLRKQTSGRRRSLRGKAVCASVPLRCEMSKFMSLWAARGSRGKRPRSAQTAVTSIS